MSTENKNPFSNIGRITITNEMVELLNKLLEGKEELIEEKNGKFQAGGTLYNILKNISESENTDVELLPLDVEAKVETNDLKELVIKELEIIKLETQSFIDNLYDMEFEEQDENFEKIVNRIDDIYSKLNLANEEINQTIIELREMIKSARFEKESVEKIKLENEELRKEISGLKVESIKVDKQTNTPQDLLKYFNALVELNKKVDLQLMMLEIQLNKKMFSNYNNVSDIGFSNVYRLASKVLEQNEIVVVSRKHHGGAFNE